MTTITSADSEILDRLRSNPVFQDGEKIIESEKRAERKKLLDEYAAVKKESSNNELQKAEEAAKKQYETALASLKKVDKKYIEAHDARANAAYQYERKRLDIENELRATADPIIAEAINAWEKEYYRVQNLPASNWQEGTGQFERESGGEIMRRVSNGEAIGKLVLEIRKVWLKLEALKLQKTEDVKKEIEKIIEDLPEIGTATERWGIPEGRTDYANASR